MSILSRPKLAPQQRFDLEDWNALLGALCGDSKLRTQKFWSSNPLILNGFVTSGIGNTSATIAVAGGALVAAGGTNDQSWFVAPSAEPDKVVSLQAGVKNYLEITLSYVGDNELLRAFWDATANGGVGAEFNQLTETIQNLELTITTSTAGFSGDANNIPISIVETDGGGAIVSILDHRDLFWRLGQPDDSDRSFAWGTNDEPTLDITLSGIVGVFTEGEIVTFDGAETAEVVSFAGSILKVKDLSSSTFSIGDTILGAASGATGVSEQAIDMFTGADKDVKDLKSIIDALMTEIKIVKGTKKWFEAPQNSLVGIADFMNSTMVQATAGAKFAWDGTDLEITDVSATPADADVVGYLRQMGKATDMSLTRQSKGLEVQKISFDAVPDTGSMTLEHNGDTSDTINAGDDAAAVQVAINAQWAAQVTVTGDFANGFTMTFDVAGDVAEMTEASNSLQASGINVNSLITTSQNGYAGGSAITIGLDQVMFIKVPTSGDRVFDGVGTGDTNYQVLDRAAFAATDETYWIAYNEGGVLYIRGRGELEAGEDSAISDPDKETLVALINANTKRDNQDRTSTLIEGGVWSLDGNDLTFSSNAFISMGGLEKIRNSIAPQTITLPNPSSVAYVTVNRDGTGSANIPVQIADIEDLILTDDVFVIARKITEGVLVGSSCFQLKNGERLELEGSLAEINRLLGQMKINEHESDADKARISTSEILQLDGTTLNQIIGNFLLRFDGAVIDFTTGEVFEQDGATPLGTGFTPLTIPLGEYAWYGLSLLPGSLNALNEQLATVQVDLASGSDAAAASAPFPVISGTIKRGWVQVQNNSGSIEVNDIKRLGVGSGSGSGGSGGSARDAYEDRLDFSIFQSVSATAFNEDQDAFIDPASTGSNSPADDNAFKFSSISETMIDINNATSGRFLESETDITKAELYVRFKESAIDESATYELSRDGGNEYQTVTMERVGTDTNAYRGFLNFEDESVNQTLQSQTTPDTNEEMTDTGSGVSRAVPFTPTNVEVLKVLSLDFNKLEAVAGNLDNSMFTVKIVRDDTGAPSTDVNDIIAETNQINMSSLASGSATADISITDTILLAGVQVWIVVETDAAYKAAFNTGVDALSLRINTTSPTNIGQVFDGTTWTATTGEGASFIVKGREIDLRVRITAGTADTLIESYGVYYDEIPGITADSGSFEVDVFEFSGDENRTVFNLVNISNPIPSLLQVYDVRRGQVYTDGEDTYRIQGNSLVFEPNMFDDPGEVITLKVVQMQAGITDNSDANAAQIASILNDLIDMGDQIESVSDSMVLPMIAAPHTTVTNRSEMPDLSMDLKPRMGIDRMLTQKLAQEFNEVGPNGESVYSVENDKFNQIRFIGLWETYNTFYGAYALPTSLEADEGSDVEITFYGTGLNVMILPYVGQIRTTKVIVDGVPQANVALTDISGSDILGGRGYASNTVVPVVSGLTLGTHTVRLGKVANLFLPEIFGFEILTETTELQITPGAQLYKGKRLVNPTAISTPYNSDFETGVLGTKGGKVVVYQKADGSIAKAVTATDASQGNLGAASHANEEVIRSIHFREFGAGRSDDFSYVLTPIDRAYTLSDGTTSLVGKAIYSDLGIYPVTSGDFFTLTFVGTGIDFVEGNTAGITSSCNIYVDGVSITGGSVLQSTLFKGKIGATTKLVSGLPYGTHTVRFERTAAFASATFFRFLVHGPKTPAIPAGAKALSEYFVMADLVENSTAAINHISTGVLRKNSSREFSYIEGTGGSTDWTLSMIPTITSGFQMYSDRLNSAMEYTFFGTGIDLRFSSSSNRSTNIQVSIDGLNADTTNFPSIAGNTSTYGPGITFNEATGILDQGDAVSTGGCGAIISNLPLGVHTIKFTNNVASSFLVIEALDVITPIHAPKLVGPKILQNEATLGSQAIADLRKFSKKDVRTVQPCSDAMGIQSESTTSTSFVPLQQMNTTIVTEGNPIEIDFNVDASCNAVSAWQVTIFVDGIRQPYSGGTKQQHQSSANHVNSISGRMVVPVGAGSHTVEVHWLTSGGTVTARFGYRNLIVKEQK